MNSKKIAALLLGLLITLGTMAGCDKKEDPASKPESNSDTSNVTESSASDSSIADGESTADTESVDDKSSSTGSQKSESSRATSSASKPAELVGNVYTTGFPIVKEKVNLKVMVVKGSGHGDYNKMRFTTELEKKTNVKVEWMVVAEGQQVEKKELALRSGNLPHIMTLFSNMVNEVDVNRYSKEGVFLDVSTQLAKWAPHVKANLDKYPYAKVAATMPDNKIYSLPLIRDEGPSIHYWVINKKWLSKLGLKAPTTTDELYRVMKQFKNGNPDGDNIANQIPFASWCWHPSMFNPWGLTLGFGGNGMVINKSGEIEYAYQSPNFKEGIEFWNKAYKEDLIGKKILNTDYDEYQKQLKTGKVGIFIWSWPVSALGYNLAQDYEILPIPDSRFQGNFKTGIAGYSTGASSNSIFFTKVCNSKAKNSADLATALRWMDYFYTMEGSLFKQYADPGYKYYDKEGDKYRMRDLTGLNPAQDAPTYGLPGLETSYKDIVLQAKNQSKESILSTKFEESAKTIYAKQKYYSLPFMTYTVDEIKAINKYSPYFGDDWSKGIGFIEGTRPMSEYESLYLADMTAKGIDKYMAPYKSAYTRAKKLLK